MRKGNFKFLFVIGLMLTLGLTSALAFGGDTKKPKNTGTLTVKTSPVAYPVKVNGEYKGMSGVTNAAEFFLPPGTHKLEIEFPNGKTYTEDIQIIKDRKNCICLKYVETTSEKACPYNVRVNGPDELFEGDLITFAAFNAVTGASVPLNYRWKVSPESATITSGQGTSAITVDTSNLGGQSVRAELEVWDDIYAKQCGQMNDAKTKVKRFEKVKPEAVRCDIFESGPFDDAKARFDNCVIQLNSIPDGQLYFMIYQGTDKISQSRDNYDKLSKRTLDYLVKTRAVDPRRISIVKGGRAPLKTTIEIWIVPPGAELPLPQ